MILRALVLALLAAVVAPARADIPAANVANLGLKWQASGGVTGGAVLRDGRLYLGSWDSKVRALDPVTGAVLWSHTVSSAIAGAVALDDQGVCYGTLTGEVGCLN